MLKMSRIHQWSNLKSAYNSQTGRWSPLQKRVIIWCPKHCYPPSHLCRYYSRDAARSNKFSLSPTLQNNQMPKYFIIHKLLMPLWSAITVSSRGAMICDQITLIQIFISCVTSILMIDLLGYMHVTKLRWVKYWTNIMSWSSTPTL